MTMMMWKDSAVKVYEQANILARKSGTFFLSLLYLKKKKNGSFMV